MFRMKKLIAFLMAATLCLGMLSVGALALEMPDLSVLEDVVEAVEAAETEASVDEAVTAEEEAPVLFAEGVASGTCGESATWTLSEDGVLTVSGTGPMADANHIQKPSWSEYSDSIESVVVEKGITTLGNYVFYELAALKEVALPDSLVSIGDGAFGACGALTEITVPEGVVTLGDEVFYLCRALTDIRLPGSLESVGRKCFIGCSSLRSVVLPRGMTSVGSYAFMECEKLLTVTIHSGMETIGRNAFASTHALTHVLFIGTEEQWKAVTVENFNGCLTNLSPCFGGEGDSVGLSETCTHAYIYCSGCAETIEYGKYPAEHVFVNGLCSGCGLGYTVLEDSTAMITSVPLREGKADIPGDVDGLEVTALASDLFENNTDLTTVVIPWTVKAVGENAFAGCTAMDFLDYGGSEEEWTLMEIAPGNEPLLRAWNCRLFGNVNGDSRVDTADLVTLMKYLAGTVSDVNRRALDVNEDGSVDILDVLRLANHLAWLSWEEGAGGDGGIVR